MNRKKGWLLLAVVLVAGLLLAGCQQKPSALGEEVQTLYKQVQADYDKLVASLGEAGMATVDGVKELTEGASEELAAIGEKVKDSELAKRTEAELQSLKETLGGLQTGIGEVATSVEEALKSMGDALSGSLSEAMESMKGGLETLLGQAKAQFDTVSTTFEGLSEEAGEALKADYEAIKAQIETLSDEIANSEAVNWTEEKVMEFNASLSSLVKDLSEFGGAVQAQPK